MNLILREPQLIDEEAFEKIKDTPILNNQTFLLNYKPNMSYKDFVQISADHASGKNLPSGFVPASFYFAFVNDEIVGRLSVRWEMNDILLKIAGHIGFVVVPKHQRKGYASEMLRQALEFAKARGLTRVLLTCDDDNTPSIKTIEKFGARLENVYVGPEAKKPKRRYWIEVG